MPVKQGHKLAVGRRGPSCGAQGRFCPLAADLGFYQQIMRGSKLSDESSCLFFGFPLANGFGQEPFQAVSYAWGSNGEGIDNRQSSLACRQVASSLGVPNAFEVIAYLDEHTQIIPEF